MPSVVFNAETALAKIREDTMLSRHHGEIVRSMVRLQLRGLYTRQASFVRFDRLVKATQMKMGVPIKRGRVPARIEFERNRTLDLLMEEFQREHPPPSLNAIFATLRERDEQVSPKPAVVQFVQPVFQPGDERKSLKRVVAEMKGEKFDVVEIEDLVHDHEPDFTGVVESAFFIGVGGAGDPRGITHPVPEGYDDPDAGWSPLEAFWKDHQSGFGLDEAACNPWLPLSYASRGLLRRLDMQTWEDYCLDHAAEIREELSLNSYLSVNPPGPEGSNGMERVSLEEMWEDYMDSQPLSRRLELMMVADESKEI